MLLSCPWLTNLNTSLANKSTHLPGSLLLSLALDFLQLPHQCCLFLLVVVAVIAAVVAALRHTPAHPRTTDVTNR